MRNMESLGEDRSAVYFDKEAFSEDIEKVERYIVSRVREIAGRSQNHLADDFEEVLNELDEFVDYWQEAVNRSQEEGDTPLYFGRKHMVTPPVTGEHRLLKQYHSSGKDDAKETLTSMRNVDSSVTGNVIIWED